MTKWRRTCLNGEIIQYDFCLEDDEGKSVGRIYRIPHHPNEGKWSWSVTKMDRRLDYTKLPPRHGLAETKDEAVRLVIEAYDYVMSLPERPMPAAPRMSSIG